MSLNEPQLSWVIRVLALIRCVGGLFESKTHSLNYYLKSRLNKNYFLDLFYSPTVFLYLVRILESQSRCSSLTSEKSKIENHTI